MPTFTESTIRKRARMKMGRLKTAKNVLNEEVAASKKNVSFDVFLSHSILDAELILGVKSVLEDYGQSVYVDWLEDPQLDRTKVDAKTAKALRSRMRQCKSLVYVHSVNSGTSKWMPWELGYFDGFKRTVAIFPITDDGGNYIGQEYLGIYPYIDETKANGGSSKTIWVNKNSANSARWDSWIANPTSFQPNV